MDINLTINFSILILTILGILLSFFALMFSIVPFMKKIMIKKTFLRIYGFYTLYSKLNPFLYYDKEKIKKINYYLVKQSVAYFSIPRPETYFCDSNEEEIDLLSIFEISLTDCLMFQEIFSLYRTWYLIEKKINYIKNVLNQFNYIVYSPEKKIIGYRDMWFNLIERTSISICPTFDELKLFGFSSETFINPTEKKYDLNQMEQQNKRKKFIKELKDKKFSLNIQFKNNKFPQSSYSLFFDKEKNISIIPYYQKNFCIIDEEMKQSINFELSWINKIFNTNFKFNKDKYIPKYI